ncbi:Gamma-tubulin complex component 6 [Allomyces arbusculus]|nr:Gamma-tubulin complex component 6 [Allomyces arbusculus]
MASPARSRRSRLAANESVDQLVRDIGAGSTVPSTSVVSLFVDLVTRLATTRPDATSATTAATTSGHWWRELPSSTSTPSLRSPSVARAWATLLETTITSPHKSAASLTLADAHRPLAEILYLMRVGARRIDRADRLDTLLQPWLDAAAMTDGDGVQVPFPRTPHDVAAMRRALVVGNEERVAHAMPARRVSREGLRSLLYLLAMLSAPPPVDDEPVAMDLVPQVVISKPTTAAPWAAPAPSAATSAFDQAILSYQDIKHNPSLRADHASNVWRVAYSADDYARPLPAPMLDDGLDAAAWNPNVASVLDLPAIGEHSSGARSILLSDQPTSTGPSNAVFAPIPPLSAVLSVPPLPPESEEPFGVLDWISMPYETPRQRGRDPPPVDPVPPPESEPPTWLELTSSLRANPPGDLPHAASLDLNQWLEAGTARDQTQVPHRLLTWEALRHPTTDVPVAIPAPPVAYFGGNDLVSPFLTECSPAIFNSLYLHFFADAHDRNRTGPAIPERRLVDHVAMMLNGHESTSFDWVATALAFEWRRDTPTPRVEGVSLTSMLRLVQRPLRVATALRRLEEIARDLRHRMRTVGFVGCALAASLDQLASAVRHGIIEGKPLTTLRSSHARLVTIDQFLDQIMHALGSAPNILYDLPYTGLVFIEFLEQLAAATTTLHPLDTTKLIVTDPGAMVAVWAQRAFAATLHPLIQWIQQWLPAADRGESGYLWECTDPYREFLATWTRHEAADGRTLSFWDAGFLVHPNRAVVLPAPTIRMLVDAQKVSSALTATADPEMLAVIPTVHEWTRHLVWPTTARALVGLHEAHAEHVNAVHATVRHAAARIVAARAERRARAAHLATAGDDARSDRAAAWYDRARQARAANAARKQALLRDLQEMLEMRKKLRVQEVQRERAAELQRMQARLVHAGNWAKLVEAEKARLLDEYEAKIAQAKKEARRVAWRRERLAVQRGDGEGGGMEDVEMRDVGDEDEDVEMRDVGEDVAALRGEVDGGDRSRRAGIESVAGSAAVGTQPSRVGLGSGTGASFAAAISPLSPDPATLVRSATSRAVGPDQEQVAPGSAPISSTTLGSLGFQVQPVVPLAFSPTVSPPSSPSTAPDASGASSLPWSTEPMSGLLSTMTMTDAEETSGLPSATQFFRLEPDVAPFAVAQDEFARFVTTSLLLAEYALLAVYLSNAKLDQYLDLLHRFFLLRDEPFRDQLCDILVAKPVHPGAVMRDLTHRLNMLLTDVDDLSFSINTEHVGTEPHDAKFYDFLSLNLTVTGPHVAVLTPSILGKYNRIFRFLLSLLSLQRSTQSIFADSREAQRLALPVDIDPTVRGPVKSMDAQLGRFRIEAHHVIAALWGYVSDAALGASWQVFVDTLAAARTTAVDASCRTPTDWRDHVLGGDTTELSTDATHPIAQPTGTLTSVRAVHDLHHETVCGMIFRCLLHRRQRPLQETLYVQARSVGVVERVARAYLHVRHDLAHGARVASGVLADLAARLTTAADEYRDATRLLVRILMSVEERTAGNGAYAVVRRRSIAGAAATAGGGGSAANPATRVTGGLNDLLVRLDFNRFYEREAPLGVRGFGYQASRS